MDFMRNFLENTWKLTSDMAIWLWAGFIIAAVLHVFAGVKRIQKYMGGEGAGSIVRSAIVGIPLPLCSCGVLPVAAALRNSGAGKSPVMTFLITTPVTGVDSIAATWALMGWVFTLARLIASVIIGLAAGFANLILSNEHDENEKISAESKADNNNHSFKDFIAYAFVEMPSMIAGSILTGLLLGGLITTLIPPGSIPSWMTSGVGGIAISVAIAVPLYVCATGSIPVAAALLAAGFSPGAALAFLIAGPATNAVAVSTVYKILGKKAVVIYLSVIGIGSFLLGMTFDFIVRIVGIGFSFTTVHNHSTGTSWYALIAAAALLLLLIFYFLTNLKFIKKIINRKSQKNEGDDMGKIIIEIPDMTCNHCRMNVSNTLKDLKNLTSFEIDLSSKTAILNTGENFDLNLALHRLSDSGYASIVKNQK